MYFFPILDHFHDQQNVMEDLGRLGMSWKILEGHGRSYPKHYRCINKGKEKNLSYSLVVVAPRILLSNSLSASVLTRRDT